ncbi:MAG TPA: outer membrane beta-barrel protein [Gammaproteobacteria bacterium]|nr:outer membrane beta-barrel protein [Gammaproteobacteria bacterium]
MRNDPLLLGSTKKGRRVPPSVPLALAALQLAALAFAALAPHAAAAQAFDYTYVEGAYLNRELDVGPRTLDGDGLGITGSLALGDKYYVFADYGSSSFDLDVDTSGYDLGVGRRWPLQQKLDAFVDLAFVHARVETRFGNADDDGYGVDAGLRSRVADKVELQGAISYVDLSDSDTSLSIAGRYYLTSTVAVGAGYVFNNDDGGWNVTLRAEFGR